MQLPKTKQGSPGALAPIAVEILLCRCSAQKIGTDNGKKLQKKILNLKKYTSQPAPSHPFKKNNSNNLINKIKNSDTTKNYGKDHRNSQKQIKDPKTAGPKGSPYDPENPRKESQGDPKDITGKDIDKDLIENDPSKGSQTDMDTNKSDEAQSDHFQTSELDPDNPVKKEFEIGELGNEELKEDEITRNETGHSAPGNRNLPSENFNVLINEGLSERCPLADQKKKGSIFVTIKKKLPNDQK